AGAYSDLVLRDGSTRLHSKSLDRLLAVLPATFERVHRSYLVRMDEVVRLRVREGSRYHAVLASGDEVPVGRTRVEAVRQRLILL
ncbi:MAG: LytTR family DNA-binding domain-containing protein, partial [Bacteroidota bacterium]